MELFIVAWAVWFASCGGKSTWKSRSRRSQADVSTAAHWYVLLAASRCCSQQQIHLHPDTRRHNLIHESESVFWCSPSCVFIITGKMGRCWRRPVQQFACMARPALQWKKCGWNYRFEGELNLRGHLCTWKLLQTNHKKNSSSHVHSKYCRSSRICISAGAFKRIKEEMSWQNAQVSQRISLAHKRANLPTPGP